MTRFQIAILFCAGLVYAQDGGTTRKEGAAPQSAQPQADSKADSTLVRRLESVTWTPLNSELSWVVSDWDMSVSREQPVAKRSYAVHLDTATMKYQGESRPFDPEEVRYVRVLMYVISTYAMQSTVWWDYPDAIKPSDGVAPGPDKGDHGKDKDQKAPPQPGPILPRGPNALNQVRNQP